MSLTERPYSANCFMLSKVWFRCATVNLRVGDFKSINSSIKQWMYADLLFKPEELILFRPVRNGGLGLVSVPHKALACFIRTFLEMTIIPQYDHSLFLSSYLHAYVLDEDKSEMPLPPYLNYDMFVKIKAAMNQGNGIAKIMIKHW